MQTAFLKSAFLERDYEKVEPYLTIYGESIEIKDELARMDASNRLFDMYADPSQSKNIAAEQLGVFTAMKKALNQWQQDVWEEKAPLQTAKGSVDPRPIAVYRSGCRP